MTSLAFSGGLVRRPAVGWCWGGTSARGGERREKMGEREEMLGGRERRKKKKKRSV